MKLVLMAMAALLAATGLAGAEPAAKQELAIAQPGKLLVQDDFRQAEKMNRRLTRGEWMVKVGLAVCTQDDELFKKYKNHGPAIWYDQEFTDGIVRFEYWPSSECQHFVFTVNGAGGHVFRFVTNEIGTDVRAWTADHKPQQLAKQGPPLVKNAWTAVTVELLGPRACLHIGDKYQVTVESSSYAAAKTVVGVSFHYGTVKLRDLELRQAQSK